MSIFLLFYIITVFILWVWILFRTQKKMYSGLISFWILSFPVLNREEFKIHTPWQFDLQPTRIFLIASIIFLFVSFLFSRKDTSTRVSLHSLELLIILYACICTISVVNNSKNFNQFIPLISGQIVFVLMYIISRRYIPEQDYIKLGTVFVIFSIFSVFVAIIQFFVDTNFMRLSSERLAYGDVIRANGFMMDEYDHGVFLTFLSVWVIYFGKNKILNFFLVCYFGIGVLLTMHRGSWLTFGFVMTIIWIMAFKKNKKQHLLLDYLLVIFSLILVLIAINSNIYISQEFVSDQLFRDTLSTRMDLNNLAIKTIQKYPFGVGDYSLELYWQVYFENGFKYYFDRPLIIHNGYLGAFVKYGIAGGICFILILVMVFYSCLQQRAQPFKTIPFLCCLGFVIINFTQDFSYLGSVPQLTLAFILGSQLRE